MLTEKEVKKLKDDAQKSIEEIQDRLLRTNDLIILQNLSDRKRQYMAQYNILLEVLK